MNDVATNASSYNLGFPDMTRDLNCTQFQATVGLSMYTLGFALTPLVTASFSEEFGRQPLYLVSTLGFAMMHLVVALYVPGSPFYVLHDSLIFSAHDIESVQVARFFSGAFGSTGSTMVSTPWPDTRLPPVIC